MANSPRPAVWELQKSSDNGATWSTWQYFADSASECQNVFNTSSSNKLKQDDQVICVTEYSKIVPLEGGEIVVSLVNNRPSSKNFSHSDVLQNWTRATNVRLRLLRTKTLLSHLVNKVRKDPYVTRRVKIFFSLKTHAF
jgi:laminin alpha 3/5